jgi:hypothetical protein
MTPEELQGILGPQTQQIAQQNTAAGLSTSARLAQANTDAVRKIKNELNARGLLNSGETGFQLGREQQSYGQAQFDARSKLLDYLNQYQGGWLAAQQGNAQSLAQAASQAADRQYSLNQGSAGSSANFDHFDTDGSAIYKDSAGNLYTSDGQKYTGPKAPTTGPAAPGGTHYENPVANIPGNPYQAAEAPGTGNQYGSLDPGLAAALLAGGGGASGSGFSPASYTPPPAAPSAPQAPAPPPEVYYNPVTQTVQLVRPNSGNWMV